MKKLLALPFAILALAGSLSLISCASQTPPPQASSYTPAPAAAHDPKDMHRP